MNQKNVLPWLIGGVLIVVGIVVLRPSSDQPTADLKPTELETSLDSSNDTQMTPTKYTPYSPVVFDAASSTRRVLFFYASWCGECRPVDAELTKRLDDIPEDVTVIRVNYNDPDTDQNEKDLAVGYGVTYQHTFVQIDSDGKEVEKWNGGGLDTLLSKIQ
jgi:thiol-disulfide isomerase/thioredoxin